MAERIKCGCPKPVMRGLHLNMALRNLYAAVAVSGITTALFYLLHNRKRKQAYKRFYANYDAEKSFNRMMAAGYLSSCPPSSSTDKDYKEKKDKKK